jgi:hypothetical protein
VRIIIFRFSSGSLGGCRLGGHGTASIFQNADKNILGRNTALGSDFPETDSVQLFPAQTVARGEIEHQDFIRINPQKTRRRMYR